jgi:hypothetical protein
MEGWKPSPFEYFMLVSTDSLQLMDSHRDVKHVVHERQMLSAGFCSDSPLAWFAMLAADSQEYQVCVVDVMYCCCDLTPGDGTHVLRVSIVFCLNLHVVKEKCFPKLPIGFLPI